DVQKALYGKSEAEIKAIQDAFHRVGLDLEAELRDELDGAELGKALELMRHKDTDLAPIPEGVDRAAMTKAAENIHDLAGKAGGSADIAKELAGMRREQIQAMVALYKDRYRIDLADDLKDRLPAGTFAEIAKKLPQTKDYPDGSTVETVKGKVTLAEVAVEKGGELEFNRREFRYHEKDELTEVTSTFTGRTWTRRVVNGQEEWVSKKEGDKEEKVWKGTMTVDADGILTFTPHDGRPAFKFTRDGKTERVPVEEVKKPAAPADVKTVEKPAAPADAKPGASEGEKVGEKPGERSFECDGKGDLYLVNNPDGSSIRKEGEPPVWREYAKDEKPTGRSYEEVSVDDETGDLITWHRDKDGVGIRIANKADGSHAIENGDSIVYKDREGHVTRKLDKQANQVKRRSFESLGDEGLFYVNNPDGSSIRKEGEPPVWREYAKDEKPTGRSYEEVSVDDETGDLITWHRDKDG